MPQQAIPLLALTGTLTGAVSARRFVTAGYAQAGAGAAVFGVARTAGDAGDAVTLDVFGTALVAAGAAIAAGADVQSDASGRAITAAGGIVVGTALGAAAAAGDTIEVLLIAGSGSKLGHVVASNDVTAVSDNGALPISGISLIAGGTGLAGLTLAAPQPGCLARVRVASLSSGNVVITTAAGVTFDGTNNTATMNAVGDELVLGYASATAWKVIENTSTTLSAV